MVFITVLRQGVKKYRAVQEEEVVVVGSLYVYSWKYCGISRAMVLLCATPAVSPAPLSHLCRTAGVIFSLQIDHVGVLNKMKFRFHWTPLLSSLILPAFPHFGSYQLGPTGPSPRVVDYMAEQGCPGMEAAPHRQNALLCSHKSSPNAPTTPCPQLP